MPVPVSLRPKGQCNVKGGPGLIPAFTEGKHCLGRLLRVSRYPYICVSFHAAAHHIALSF